MTTSTHPKLSSSAQGRRGRALALLATAVLASAGARAQSMGSPTLGPRAPTAAPAPALSASATETSGRLKALKDKMSYATGVMTARNLKRNEVPFDLELLVQGIKDAAAKGPLAMDDAEIRTTLMAMQADMKRHIEGELMAKSQFNRERGEKFQTEYQKQPDAKVLPGNLMVRVLKPGSGERPAEDAKVVLRYRGKFVDGTEFESTPEGRTVTMKMTEMISGWREALKQMDTGSIWEVVVPPSMAYGTRGAGEKIGPNETLIFTVELVAVVHG